MDIGPGSLVECIDDSDIHPFVLAYWSGGEIVRGRIYEVEGCAPPSWVDGSPTIHLVGVRSADDPRVGFNLKRFRPIDDGRIEIFRELVADLDKELVQ